MKILLTTGIFPPEIGGPSTYVYSFSKWLIEKGTRVKVVTALKNDFYLKYPFPVEIVKKKGSYCWHLKSFFKIFKPLKNFDVLYANGLFFESFVAAFFRRKKFVLRIPGDVIWERAIRKKWTDKNILDFQINKSNFRIRLLKYFRNLYLNYANIIIVPSVFLKTIVEKWGITKEKIEVIQNPYSSVISEAFNLPPQIRGKFIITTGGRLVSWKGVDMVIKTIADIKNSYLFIVGDGPESEKLKGQVEDLNITDRVYFTGSLSRSRLLYLLSRSNCFVLNSKYEGLSHIILEAMAAGCPVIASNCGGNPEIIKHKENGFLIEPDDIDALKRYLIELKADPRLGAVLKKNGENTISENFHPEIKYQETLGVLLE